MMELSQFFKPKKLFLIMLVFVAVLLVYANGMAFNLFSAPSLLNDLISYSAFAVAVVFAVITLNFIIKDARRKGLAAESKNLSANGASKVEESSVISPQEAIKVQKSQEKIESELSEHVDQLFKSAKTQPTKLRCPACRQTFKLPAYLEDYMIDFGPQKPSNMLNDCPNCGAPIAFKKKNAS